MRKMAYCQVVDYQLLGDGLLLRGYREDWELWEDSETAMDFSLFVFHFSLKK